ncbi:MAG: hypothetical protein COB66_02440 [Coxiella sp. (in: Bacteria)]|nr:MAG: hypothetical protein COB66_02440 [Coxiella sp. (in: g-proteobacteria)]
MRISVMMITMLLFGVVAGYEIGIFPTITNNLMTTFNFTIKTLSWAAAILPLAAAVAAVVSGWMADRFGRRIVLQLAVILFLFGIFETAIAESVAEFILGRALLGLAIGTIAVNVPLYLVELSPAQKRGQWMATFFVSFNVGVFLACLMGAVFSFHHHWRVVLILAALPVFSLYFLCLSIPESPRWLILNGRQGQASQVLIKYFGSKVAMSTINSMEAVHHRSIYQTTKLWSVSGARILLLGILINIFAQALGIHAIVTYATLLMERINVQDHFIEISASIIIAVVFMLAAILATRVMDKIPRRKLLLLGLTGMVTSLVMIAWSLHNVSDGDLMMLNVLFGCLLFIGCQGFCLAPMASLLPAELFPQSLRGVGMGISISAYWITNMIIVYAFQRMLTQYGANLSFLVFLFFAVVAIVWCYFNVPETCQVPLEKLEKQFCEGSDGRRLDVDDSLSELGVV